jgi:acetolactate synthase-1/2/3 large subunit
MSECLRSRTGGRILADALKIHGVDSVFCVPGESFLPVIDALYDARESIKLVVCRQEGGAAFMAEAYGKLTGEPGICFVTRAPGATNASIGVHTAFHDSTPMILFIGQVSTEVTEREAWQEIDYRRMFGQMAKWVAQIDRPERIPEMVARAFQTAVSGRPGPVVLALPDDMLNAMAAVADAGRHQRVQAHPGAHDLARLRDLLGAARRPFLIVGGGGWNAEACAYLQAFVEAFGLPVGSGFRRQDLLDNRHRNYAGDVALGINPKLAQRVRDADLVLAVGTRLGGITTSDYSLLSVPRPMQRLVHVHADPEELGRIYQPALMINAGVREFAAAARTLAAPKVTWSDWTEAARADYLEWLQHPVMPGPVDLGEVMALLRERLPADSILTNGAGNYALWLHRFYQYRGFGTQLAPTSGAMGYGTPAALAAKLVHPQRTVVCFAGDGCFLMNGQELATAVQYRLAVIFIVVNNAMYGTIRMHQEREFPGRVHGTSLVNPEFVALAKAYGAHAELVERTADFAEAFERARSARRPALLELRIDPEAITPRTTLTALRQQALGQR